MIYQNDLPISERVIAAVIAQLETITQASGYFTDLGSAIFRERHSIDPAQTPAASVNEQSDVPGGDGFVAQGATTFRSRLGFEVEAFAPCDLEETGEMLGLMRADIKACLMRWAAGVGDDKETSVRDADGRIGALIYNGSTARPRPEGATTEGVSVSFICDYTEVFGDPTRLT